MFLFHYLPHFYDKALNSSYFHKKRHFIFFYYWSCQTFQPGKYLSIDHLDMTNNLINWISCLWIYFDLINKLIIRISCTRIYLDIINTLTIWISCTRIIVVQRGGDCPLGVRKGQVELRLLHQSIPLDVSLEKKFGGGAFFNPPPAALNFDHSCEKD